MSKPLQVEFVISRFHNGAAFDEIRRELVQVSARSEVQVILAKLDRERQPGRSIIVRPIWIEKRVDGKMFFYDFRSFDGRPFQYVNFEV